MNYFSQFGEDKILENIFSDVTNGFCIEVGANDGVNDSTTFYFEKKGWDCLLIEPNPELCKLIRASRKCHLVECAVSDHSGKVSLFVAEGAPRAHGVSTIHGGQKAVDKIQSYGFSSKEIVVKARTLDDILQDIQEHRSINFISIDVEGHELCVLNGFSLDRWRPRIILIEDNSNCRDLSVRNFLKQYNYVPFLRTGVNDWYALSNDAILINWWTHSVYFAQKFILRSKLLARHIPGLKLLWNMIKHAKRSI